MTPGADDGDQTRTPESPESDEQQNENGLADWNGYGPPPVREHKPIKRATTAEPEPAETTEPVASSNPAESTAWNGYGPPPVREPQPAAKSSAPAEPTEPTDPVASSNSTDSADATAPGESTDTTEPADAHEPADAAELDSTESAESSESVESSETAESNEPTESDEPAESDETAESEWDGTGPPPIRRREPVIPVYPKTSTAPKGPVPGPRSQQGQRWADDDTDRPPPSNRMAVAAIILGAASIPFGLTGYLGVIAGLFAIVFGIIGLRQAKRGRSTRPRLALAGSVLGIVGLVLSIVVLVVSVHKINDCKKHIGHTPNRQELTQCAREHI